ncbi:MAG: YciI family protein [Bacteroidales bacterium]|nr:YciI family protein [Bacteroidales bacterium]
MKGFATGILLTIFLFSISFSTLKAQSDVEEEFQMKQYFMVLLTTGPNRTQDSTTAAKIQEGHLNNITRLFNEKKMILAGPFMDKGIYRGIFIFDVATEDEVKQLLQTDPAIKSGRLGYEIHPWYGPGNIVIGKK